MNAIGFTGTQSGLTYEQRARLWLVLCHLCDRNFRTMHNGDCIGADDEAYKLFRALGDVFICGHIPDNPSKRAFNKYDREEIPRPYLVRNRAIVDMSRVLVACPAGEEVTRSGTWSTVRHARKTNVDIIVVWPDGSTTNEGWNDG